MFILRKLLFPLAILYGWVTSIRNFLFDNGLLKSFAFDIPTIVVGNLCVGGTGKTPQIEYLIRLLSPKYKVAVLSRGYKRKTKGFIIADQNATSSSIGDEPYQMYSKFPKVQFAVDSDRCNGITNLLSISDKPEVILLDDAFQHRKVKAGYYVLLTAYTDLYCDDYLLPTGNLRESRMGVKRADMIIVTKCPKNLSEIAQQKILKKLGENASKVIFSFIDYDNFIYNETEKIAIDQIRNQRKVIIAGIAKPAPFFEHVGTKNDQRLEYPDHYDFKYSDYEVINSKAVDSIVITTEKDFVRLKVDSIHSKVYYLPIRCGFNGGSKEFDKNILNYVGTSTRND